MNKLVLIFLLLGPLSVNADFVDKLIDDMGNNDAVLMNAPNTDWAKHGYLDMGYSPRGDNTPSYWANAQGGSFTSSNEWEAILPWFQIWPVAGNSNNVRVKVSDIKVQMLINGQWRLINIPTNQWAQLEPWNLIGDKQPVNKRDEGNGAFSYFIANEGPVHGGLGKYNMFSLGINPWEIRGVAISAVAEIIEGNGNILFEIGGDYYPDTDVGVDDYVLGWGPAIGGSKFTKIDGPTCVYMTTIDPPGQGDPSQFAQNGGKTALSHSELRNNPPQDFCGTSSGGGGSGGDTGGGDTGGGDTGGGTIDTSNLLEKQDMIDILQNLINGLENSITDIQN